MALTNWAMSNTIAFNYVIDDAQLFNAYPPAKKVPLATYTVPLDAELLAHSGSTVYCWGCGRGLSDEKVWYYAGTGYFWCRSHKQESAATAVAKDDNKEQDVARRQDFTFPYTGTQIADSLEQKAARLESEITDEVTLDRATLVTLLGERAADQRLEQAAAELAGTNTERRKRAERARKEAIPYRQARAKEFDLDLEDVSHYGLNEAELEPAEAPKPKRTRRKRDPETQELVDA